jgi:DNA-binding CsgD family transcriptional regulator
VDGRIQLCVVPQNVWMSAGSRPRPGALERGRSSYASHAWADAFEWLSRADGEAALEPEDVELLARAAYMLGRDGDYERSLERAHYGHLDAGDARRAARCAWWIGVSLLLRGELAPARGWFARGERLLDREQHDCAEQGFVRLAHVRQHVAERDFEAAYGAAADAIEIGERFGDHDLVAFGVMEQGYALLQLGRMSEGLRLVDEGMVAVTSGELTPITAGILYCHTIAVCQNAYELRRAREWTTALTVWCEGQPEMVAHKGVCLVHRAEIMQLVGAWDAALEEARRVGGPDVPGNRAATGALYVQGELHRLRGDYAAAEEAFRVATRQGGEPQPGLALLRLAQGNGEAALAAIRRAVGEPGEPLARAALLPAYVEIALAVGEVDEAGHASSRLSAIADAQGSDALAAMSACARGAVALARGNASDALAALRHSLHAWHELDAPYEVAKTRVLIGLACAVLGDDDGATLELEAARSVFEELGARPDLARVDSLVKRAPEAAHGLSPRELEVLRLVACGETNKAIAAALVLSERTVDRHVSNIYTKLGVSSRAAATAYAYEQRLV